MPTVKAILNDISINDISNPPPPLTYRGRQSILSLPVIVNAISSQAYLLLEAILTRLACYLTVIWGSPKWYIMPGLRVIRGKSKGISSQAYLLLKAILNGKSSQALLLSKANLNDISSQAYLLLEANLIGKSSQAYLLIKANLNGISSQAYLLLKANLKVYIPRLTCY